MKKIGLYLTILLVLSGCSAARPVIRTDEASLKATTPSAVIDYISGGAETKIETQAATTTAGSKGLISVSTKADTVPSQSTKADVIRNASDKAVGAVDSKAPAKPSANADTSAGASAASTTAAKPPAASTTAQDKTSKYNLFDYYPLIENRRVELTGPSGSSSLILQYLYEESGKVTAQVKQYTAEASQLNVISITNQEITELYYSQDINYRENIIGLKDYVQRIILKAPLKIGNQWDSTGLHFEITAVDEPRRISGKDLTVMDVTVSTGTEKIRFTYAVGVGLVSNDVIQSNGSLSNIIRTDKITDEARDVYPIDFYYPNSDGQVTVARQDVQFKTNDATKDKLAEVYKSVAASKGYTPVLGDKTQIQYIFSKDNIVHADFNQAFIDFINQSPELENKRIESLVDTLCSFYGADGLILTINDQRYESQNRKIEPTEILKPVSIQPLR